MGHSTVHIETTVRAPIQLVFDRLTDHEAMNEWPGVSKCRLIEEGTPRNGVGAVRAIKAGGVTLHEKVVHFEPPTRFEYQIIKGLPVSHLGSVTLAPVASPGDSPVTSPGDALVRLRWHISISSRVPLLARVVCFQLRRGLPRALDYFIAETEKAARAAA